MPGGRDDEERVTAGDKCGGEQLICKRKEDRRKKGGGAVSGLLNRNLLKFLSQSCPKVVYKLFNSKLLGHHDLLIY